MKIVLIRHARVAFTWEPRYTSAQYDAACAAYDAADAAPDPVEPLKADGFRILVSPQKRAVQTARQLFETARYEQLDLLKEVPLRSFCDTKKQLPRLLFDILGRIQWAVGSSRQPETKKETVLRARQVVSYVEELGGNVVIVSHGFFLRTLMREFSKSNGYSVKSGSLFSLPPLGRVLITKASEHCGGCTHNCLLENPGCGIGQLKARERQV